MLKKLCLLGSPGIVGSLMVGVFSDGTGLIHGAGFSQLLYQFAGSISVFFFWPFLVIIVISFRLSEPVF